MPFIFLTFFAALSLEIIGSYISISGLAAKTSFIVVLIAIALDLAKVVIASALYKKWKKINVLLKCYLFVAVIFLSLVTSFGAYGLISQEFGKTVLAQEKFTSQLEVLQAEQTKLETRKSAIDKQISELPSDQVNQRRRLNELFAAELERINARLEELNKTIPDLKLQSITEAGTNGTIGSVSKSLSVPTDTVIRYASILVTLFVDPLAIALLILANFLIEDRRQSLRSGKSSTHSKLEEAEEKLVEAIHSDDSASKNVNNPLSDLHSAPAQEAQTKEVIKEGSTEVIKEVMVEVPVEVIKEVPIEVIKEVVVEVPVEVIKEVIKEVPTEVIKEVIVEVPVEVIKEVFKDSPVTHNTDNDYLTENYQNKENMVLASFVAEVAAILPILPILPLVDVENVENSRLTQSYTDKEDKILEAQMVADNTELLTDVQTAPEKPQEKSVASIAEQASNISIVPKKSLPKKFDFDEMLNQNKDLDQMSAFIKSQETDDEPI